jgi:hypothetical protein
LGESNLQLNKLKLGGDRRQKEENPMTKREFLNAIVNGTMNDEIVDFAKDEIAKLDATNEKRKNKPSKKATENAPIVDALVEMLTDTPVTASGIAEVLGVSVQKASALARVAVADGRATAVDVKIPKKGTQKGYVAVVAE